MMRSIGVILITLAITQIDAHDYNEEGWKSASELLRAAMNSDTQPCRDFYGYACGDWKTNLTREANTSVENAEMHLRDILLTALDKISVYGNDVQYQKSVRVIYDKCLRLPVMNERELQEALINAVVDVLTNKVRDTKQELIDILANDNVLGTVGWLEKYFLGSALFETSVQWKQINCTPIAVLTLSPPYEPTLDLTQQQIGDLLKIYPANFTAEYAEKLAKNTTEFSRRITELVKERDAKKGTEEADEVPIRRSQLALRYPKLDWDAFFQTLFPETGLEKWNATDPYIVVIGDSYFKKLPELLDEFDYDTVESYSIWKLYDGVKTYYTATTSTAVASSTSREKKVFCYDILKEFAPGALARLAFHALGAEVIEWRKDIEVLAENILSAFRIFVSGQDWMDAQDKMSIVDRINRIRLDPGIPMWLANDSEVARRTPTFDPQKSILWNIFDMRHKLFLDAFRPLTDASGSSMEEDTSEIFYGAYFKPWAYYSFEEIFASFGQVMPPFYHHHYPLAVKYGMLGWMIGHQLMHAFDEGSLLGRTLSDHEDSLNIREEAKKLFKQRTRCLVKQYSAYCYRSKGGQCISGAKTVDENIGDIEGLKIAYMAYKFVTQTMGSEPPMPEMVTVTNDQAFFISAAQLYCSKDQDWVAGELYAPNKVRVEQSVRNFPVFARAFKCKKGTKFAPIRTCSLWGRFVSPNQCEVDTYSGRRK